MRFTSRVAAALFAVLTLLPMTAFAATTGNLFGIVTDNTGAVLPGVTVTITGSNLQGSRTAITNESGEYHLNLIPPGTYRLEASLSGLSPSVRDNVRVSLDTTTRQDLALGMGAVAEAITVTADAVVVDPTATTVQQNFGTQHLKYAAIGTAGRSYQTVLSQAPGVAGGSNPNVLGSNLGQNNYMLDGVNTTDPVTHTFGSNLPFDAIQEISIQTLGKDAEYGRAIGGVVNVVTKTGGNEFSGSFDARIQNQDTSESGDHFDASTQQYREFKPAASLGGPIARDRVWFFGSVDRPDNTRTPVTRPNANWTAGDRTFEGWNSLGKITATPAANHTLSFRFTDNRATINHSRDSSFYRPEADSYQLQESTIYNVGYDSILSPQWLAQVQVGVRRGYLESGPMSGDLNAIGLTNNRTSIRWGNYTNFQGGDRDRDELIASTTYFLNAFGSHTIKGGINFDQASFNSFNNPTGLSIDQSFCAPQFGQPAGARCGAAYISNPPAASADVNAAGTPVQLNVITYLDPEETNSELRAYYIQDEWHPITPVTLRLGLRYETINFTTPGATTPSFEMLQPRIGAAWDVFNNARTIVHGFWGRVMDDNGLTLASFLSTQGQVTSRFIPNAAGGWTFHSAIGGASGNQADPDLQPTYGEEATIGITQRVFTNTSLDVSVIQRDTYDIFEDSCETITGHCEYFWVTNKPNEQDDVLRSDYQGIITKLESRPFSWLSGLVSYTWAKSRGSVEYTQNAGVDFDVAPEHFVNTYGFMSDDARHRVKASGFVRAPWGTTIGVDASWRSGAAYSRTAGISSGNNNNPLTLINPNLPQGTAAGQRRNSANIARFGAGYGTLFLEPRGSQRTPSFTQVDLQLMHEFTFGRVRAGLIGSIFNVVNTETPTTIGGSIGTYSPCTATSTQCFDNPLFGTAENDPDYRRLAVASTTFGTETAWQRPRRYEVGIRFEF